VVLLCDQHGVAIEHRGEEALGDQFRFWGPWLGGVWSEEVEGTNGIGTCIAEKRPITVHLSQHFRARHIALSCIRPRWVGRHVRAACRSVSERAQRNWLRRRPKRNSRVLLAGGAI
jgi:hypothetical protein